MQYSDIMRFLVGHNRHHKVSRSSYVTKLLLFCEELGLGGHFRDAYTISQESYYAGVLNNSSKKRNLNKSVGSIILCLRM